MAKKSERELIEAMRNDIRKAEVLMNRALATGKLVVAANADDAVRLNAASKAVALLKGGVAGFELAHADATDILLANWPGFGAEVVVLGPGR